MAAPENKTAQIADLRNEIAGINVTQFTSIPRLGVRFRPLRKFYAKSTAVRIAAAVQNHRKLRKNFRLANRGAPVFRVGFETAKQT